MTRLGSIEPELLRTFVCIAETGSFTAAAGIIGRTQSTVSVQMRKLEQVLGHTLLVRGRGSHVRLSGRGTSLLVQAKELLTLHDAIWNEFRGSGAEKSSNDPPADYSLPIRAQREAFTSQIMMTLLTNERFVEAYSLVMRLVELKESVDPTAIDPKSDALFMGLLSMLEYVSINFLSNTIDREMLLRQRRSGLIRVYETLRPYIEYKRLAWNRPNAYRSFEAMIKDHALGSTVDERMNGHDAVAPLALTPDPNRLIARHQHAVIE